MVYWYVLTDGDNWNVEKIDIDGVIMYSMKFTKYVEDQVHALLLYSYVSTLYDSTDEPLLTKFNTYPDFDTDERFVKFYKLAKLMYPDIDSELYPKQHLLDKETVYEMFSERDKDIVEFLENVESDKLVETIYSRYRESYQIYIYKSERNVDHLLVSREEINKMFEMFPERKRKQVLN